MRAGCSRSLTTVPLRRSSPLGASSSKTPKRQARDVLTGRPMSTLLWLRKPYTVPASPAQQNSNPRFIRRAKSFRFRGRERNDQLMPE